MSRIHEALKKAEQERSTTPGTEIGLSPQEPVIIPAPARKAGPSTLTNEAVSAIPEASSSSATSVEYLRFDDLLARCAHPQWNPDPNLNVFLNPTLSPHGAEQFRTLRSRLYQLRSNQPLRTVLITSSVPAEGKTFVTNNLAQAIVRQPDRRALIIDADLRCARLHIPLGAPAAPGLTDYLRGEADEMSIIQHGLEGNLCFIPGGNEVTNPSELLSNGQLKKLLDRLAPVFDWVLARFAPMRSGCGCQHSCRHLRRSASGREGWINAPGSRSESLPGTERKKRRRSGPQRGRRVPAYGSHYYYGYGDGR